MTRNVEPLSEIAAEEIPLGVTLTPTMEPLALRLDCLVREHLPYVYRLLRHLGVPGGDVDDAVQQVFLVLNQRQTDVPDEKVKAFLSSTSVRIASRWRRTHRRRREDGDGDPLAICPTGAPSPERQLERAEAERLLLRVLSEMPDKLREVFVLFELEELSLREIGETLGLPQGTVASRLRLGRERFTDSVAALHNAKGMRRMP